MITAAEGHRSHGFCIPPAACLSVCQKENPELVGKQWKAGARQSQKPKQMRLARIKGRGQIKWQSAVMSGFAINISTKPLICMQIVCKWELRLAFSGKTINVSTQEREKRDILVVGDNRSGKR